MSYNNYFYKITIAIVKITQLTTAIVRMIFAENLSHVEYSIFAISKPPMIAPQVGVNKFTNPFPATNIMIMTSGEKPNSAARGPMIGMLAVASPLDEGIKNESRQYNR